MFSKKKDPTTRRKENLRHPWERAFLGYSFALRRGKWCDIFPTSSTSFSLFPCRILQGRMEHWMGVTFHRVFCDGMWFSLQSTPGTSQQLHFQTYPAPFWGFQISVFLLPSIPATSISSKMINAFLLLFLASGRGPRAAWQQEKWRIKMKTQWAEAVFLQDLRSVPQTQSKQAKPVLQESSLA